METPPTATRPRCPFYILRRNVEGGGRQDTFRTDSFRGVLGVRGAITENWSYDASAQFSKVKVDNFTLNRFVLPRFQRARRVDSGLADGDPLTGASGEVVCRSGDARLRAVQRVHPRGG